jgi:glycosyltransferase involved in cell wall biosynthesis
VPKVAYLTPMYFSDESTIGGGERYPTNLARGVALASGGAFQVELVSFGKVPGLVDLAPGVSLRVLEAVAVPRNPLDALSWDLPAVLADADLLHIHQAYTRCAEVGLLVAKQLRKPVCVTDHGGNSSSLGLQYGLLELADLIVANSDFGASLYRTSTEITVVKGGLDAQAYTPLTTQGPRDRVLFVGRLLPHKGIDGLIAAMPDDLPLTICGRPYHADYLAKLRKMAEGKRVEFLTDADDEMVIDLYRRAWATVLPSVYQDCYGHGYNAPELMGYSLLESMACGTPAIASRVGGMPEFIRMGETGFVFDSRDELTTYLRRLADDPALVERIGQSARATVEREYDLRVVGAKMISLYERLLPRDRAAQEAA